MSDTVTEDQAVASVTAGRDQGEPVYFNGSVADVCKMVFKFTLLTILTMGIYRFWAKTKLRRYFWSQTEFDGDRFEYHGTPKELFIGFLIVVAILAPIYFVLELIGALISTEGLVPVVIYQFVYLTAFLVLIQLAVYRMTRYRLTRTSWRGVRFGLDGNSWRYTGMASVAVLVSIFSVGLAYPWMRNWLIRYRIENMRFGERFFEYSGYAMLFAKKWWITITVSFIPLIIAALIAGIPEQADIDRLFSEIQETGESSIKNGNTLQPYAIGWVVSFLTFFVAYVWYRVGEFRIIVSKTTLGGVQFDSSLAATRIFGLIALLIGLFVVVFGVVFGSLSTLTGLHLSPAGGIVLGILVFIVVFVSLTVIPTGIYGTLQTKAVLTSVRVYNKQSLTDIAQGEQSELKYGEGLADAFDVGAF